MRRAPTKEKSSNVLANLGTTLVALLLTAAFVVFLLPVVIQTVLECQLAKITGRSVQIADVHFSLTSPQFTVKKVLFSNPAGFPDAPLSDRALEEKYLELAAPVLGQAKAGERLERLWRLE